MAIFMEVMLLRFPVSEFEFQQSALYVSPQAQTDSLLRRQTALREWLRLVIYPWARQGGFCPFPCGYFPFYAL
jgi:hypothetical protein